MGKCFWSCCSSVVSKLCPLCYCLKYLNFELTLCAWKKKVCYSCLALYPCYDKRSEMSAFQNSLAHCVSLFSALSLLMALLILYMWKRIPFKAVLSVHMLENMELLYCRWTASVQFWMPLETVTMGRNELYGWVFHGHWSVEIVCLSEPVLSLAH